jgi:hypothetical protein
MVKNASVPFRRYSKVYEFYVDPVFTAKKKYRKFKQMFPEKELRGHSPNFHIHLPVSDLPITTIDLPILLQENIWTDLNLQGTDSPDLIK